MSNSYLPQREAIKINLVNALEFHNGNRTHTAKALKIGIRTLQRNLKRYGMENYLVRKDKVVEDEQTAEIAG